ncbi:MAG TPA: hypothetical protein VF711_03490 [Acidimicrobiales bacterium]
MVRKPEDIATWQHTGLTQSSTGQRRLHGLQRSVPRPREAVVRQLLLRLSITQQRRDSEARPLGRPVANRAVEHFCITYLIPVGAP